MSNKTLILGLGNILLKDEGVGVHVVRELLSRPLPEDVQVIDGGTASLSILAAAKAIKKIIIIDALRFKHPAGTIYKLSPQNLKREISTKVLSAHQLGMLESLDIAQRIYGLKAEVIIIGVEPEQISWGLEPSAKIKQKIPQIVTLILDELKPLAKLEQVRG